MRFHDIDSFVLASENGRRYEMTEVAVWDIGRKNSGWQLTLPVGYSFDISVPRGCSWLQSPHDRRFLLAAAVHDKLLEEGHDVVFAAAELRRALIVRGFSRSYAWSVCLATMCVTAVRRRHAA